jgi:hypothetical protein
MEREAEKEKEKESNSKNEVREVAGWTFYYQKNFERAWMDHSAGSEKARKQKVDQVLQ